MPKARPRGPAKSRPADPRTGKLRVIRGGRGPAGNRPPIPPGRLVVGVGAATVDLLCAAPYIDERHVELSMFTMQGGGSAANAIATCAVLGARSRFFGRVGDDVNGRFIVTGLRELGVDTAPISVQRGRVSPVTIIQMDETTRRRRTVFTRGNTSPLETRDLPRNLLAAAGALIVDGTMPAVQAAVAEQAREAGIIVVLNADHLTGGMGELLALSDIVIGSERFAGEFAPSDDLSESLQEITRLGPRTAVITLGDAGAMALDGDRLMRRQAIDVPVMDTTGAGDVFCGAFTYAIVQRKPVEDAIAFANATAGLSCRTFGARSGLPTPRDVQRALKD